MELPDAGEVLEHLPHYLYVFDLGTGESRFLGRHLGLALGYDQDEIDTLGHAGFLASLLHPDDRARIPQLLTRWEEVDDDTIVETEHRLRRKDGQWRWFLGRDRVLERDASGRVTRLIGTSFDITTRKELESYLTTQARRDALGLLAQGVAHDLNNLLTIVFSHVELARKQADTTQTLDVIDRAARSASDLTRKLTAYAGGRVVRARPVDLSAQTSEILQLAREAVGGDQRIEARIQPDVGTVRIDPAQLERVVLNLILNARDANPAEPIEVSCEAITLTEADPTRRPDTAPGAYARVTVCDRGPGVPDDLRDRIFEPFFSTKGRSGTGLGLAIVDGVARQSRGQAWVGPNAGGGAAFHLDLPISD